jgi:NAD(P) transhydrogenase
VSDVREHYDVIVVGSGPAGQKAAVQSAKTGRRTLVIDSDAHAGGACVRRGTIPSKTLREAAMSLETMRRRTGDVFRVEAAGDVRLTALMARVESVIAAHESYMEAQLQRNHIDMWRGRARFVSPTELEVIGVGGARRRASGAIILVATGSRPRTPSDIPVDHENVFDSDSILSLGYLPASLTVIGAGVIASEYASVFAAIGVQVVMVDSGARPLAFLDEELTSRFTAAFAQNGGRFIGGSKVARMIWDGVSHVETVLDSGEVIRSEKALFALGRVANLEGLNIGAAGLEATQRGYLGVDEHCRTAVPHIFAAGDVIGPPGLASASMEQGRRAIRHALGLEVGRGADVIPTGIYTIPEMASVGASEQEVVKKQGGAIVGRSRYDELARGQIAAIQDGLLKLVADREGRRVLGVQIIGEGATELVHVGQMAILNDWNVDMFIDTIFNFPTLAEAYRVAALDIVGQRASRSAQLAMRADIPVPA